MNILITGSNGFIGNKIKESLSKNHNLICIQRSQVSKFSDNDFFIDLTDIDALKDCLYHGKLGNCKIDIIIHCAALLADGSNNLSLDLFNNNNKITESVILLTNYFKPKKLINFSTIGVYPNKDGNFNENSEVDPSENSECLYSLSKFCSEILFKFFLTNTKVINLRLAQTIGEGMRSDRMFSVYLDELKKHNQISVWGNGERESNFIQLDELLKKIDFILSNDSISGTFNIGQKNISYLELANSVIENFGDINSKIILLEKGIKSKVKIECSKFDKLYRNEQ